MTAKQVNYLYREDLTKLRKIRSETKFLCSNKIETLQDLVDEEYEIKQDLKRYQNEKQYVINRLRSASGDEKLALDDCRKRLYWCKDIKENSQKMKDKVQRVREMERGREYEQKERGL